MEDSGPPGHGRELLTVRSPYGVQVEIVDGLSGNKAGHKDCGENQGQYDAHAPRHPFHENHYKAQREAKGDE